MFQKPLLEELVEPRVQPIWESTEVYTPEDGQPVTRHLLTTAYKFQISGADPGGYWRMSLDDPLNETDFEGMIIWPVSLDPKGKYAEKAHATVSTFMRTEDSLQLELLIRTLPDLLDLHRSNQHLSS